MADHQLKKQDNKVAYFLTDPGFTLLEILIAIFIFAIVIVTIFASYRTVFSRSGAIDEDIALSEMAHNAIIRMTLDIQSIHLTLYPAYKPPGFNAQPEPYRIVGDTVYIKDKIFPRLRFTSLAHLPFGKDRRKGTARIVYYIQYDNKDSYVLRRSDNLYPYQPFEETKGDPVLCENIKNLSIKYFDDQGEAYDTWDSESEEFGYSTPVAVEIKLEVKNSSTPFVFRTAIAVPVFREKKES